MRTGAGIAPSPRVPEDKGTMNVQRASRTGVVVVGGGISGTAAAYELARAGVCVVLPLDPFRLARFGTHTEAPVTTLHG